MQHCSTPAQRHGAAYIAFQRPKQATRAHARRPCAAAASSETTLGTQAGLMNWLKVRSVVQMGESTSSRCPVIIIICHILCTDGGCQGPQSDLAKYGA